jgi:hypothetical protein
MILGAVPYSHAHLIVKCAMHNNVIEYTADEDAVGILDRLQLQCPGLSSEIRELHRQSEVVEATAMKELGLEWRTKHPEEVAMYPSGWMPGHFALADFPLRHQERLEELDAKLATLADECVDSWIVTLETEGGES